MTISEETSASAGVRAAVWTPHIRWAIAFGVFDFALVLLVVAINRGMPTPLLALYAVVVPSIFVATGMYSTRLRLEVLGRLPLTLGDVTLAVMVLVTANFMFLNLAMTSVDAIWLWVDTVAVLLAGRLLAMPVRRSLSRAQGGRKALIVGSGSAAVLLAGIIESHPELELQTIGFVDDGPRHSVRGRREPLLGTLSELSGVIRKTAADVVLFGYTHNATEEMLTALYKAEPNVEVLMMPRYFQFVSTGMRVDDLAGMPVLRISRRELGAIDRVIKRAEDLVLGGILALLIMPFVPFIALAIKLDSPGPVFFAHERVGRNGKPFRMYKFRSMRECAAFDEEALERLREADPRGLKSKGDTRVTKLGALLRKSSIDELPQLINVLKGDMSLVGPRPAVAAEVAAYDEWQHKRLTVAPGITGMWQVNGRSDVPFDERIWLDFAYIDSWSVWLDLSIMLKTIPAVLSAKGAY